MPSVTSEQLRLFKQRRAGALVVEVAALVLAPVSAVAVLVSFCEQGPASRIAAAITLFAVFFLGQFARHTLFRCPVCGAPLPRDPRHPPFGTKSRAHCNRCDAIFTG